MSWPCLAVVMKRSKDLDIARECIEAEVYSAPQASRLSSGCRSFIEPAVPPWARMACRPLLTHYSAMSMHRALAAPPVLHRESVAHLSTTSVVVSPSRPVPDRAPRTSSSIVNERVEAECPGSCAKFLGSMRVTQATATPKLPEGARRPRCRRRSPAHPHGDSLCCSASLMLLQETPPLC